MWLVPTPLELSAIVEVVYHVGNWQLTKQGIHWSVSHDRIVGLVVDPSWLRLFPNISADKLLVLNLSLADFLAIVTKWFFEVNYKFSNMSFSLSLG